MRSKQDQNGEERSFKWLWMWHDCSDFPTQPPPEFTENGPKNERLSSDQQSLYENTLFVWMFPAREADAKSLQTGFKYDNEFTLMALTKHCTNCIMLNLWGVSSTLLNLCYSSAGKKGSAYYLQGIPNEVASECSSNALYPSIRCYVKQVHAGSFYSSCLQRRHRTQQSFHKTFVHLQLRMHLPEGKTCKGGVRLQIFTSLSVSTSFIETTPS